jgi:hypothetical protein
MITEKITSGQKKQLLRVLEDGVDALDLTKEETDEILKVGNLVQADLKTSLKKHSIVDKRFGLAIREFEITVPIGYNHDIQIDASAEKVKKEKTTHYYNSNLKSKNFSKATNKLESGKTYKIKIFPILATVKSEDCVAFLEKQNAILVGGQGMMLAYDLSKDQLPKKKWTASFDKKEALWEDADGYHGVPCVGARSDGDFGFRLGDFEGAWRGGDCLLCFCDKKEL